MSSNRDLIPNVHDDEEDDAPTAQHQCVACGKLSPAAHSAHTLISAQHGWRVARTPAEGGGFHFAWHCPACWAKQRQEKIKPR